MKVAHKNYVITAEQFVPGQKLPKGCKGYGTHVTEFQAVIKIKQRVVKLAPGTWVVHDGFGNIELYSDEQFRKEYVEVK